jgi:hypothetical protein
LRFSPLLLALLVGLGCGDTAGEPSNPTPIRASVDIWSCLPGTCHSYAPLDTVSRGDSVLLVLIAVDSTRTVDSISVRPACAVHAVFTIGATTQLEVPPRPTCPDSVERIALQVLPTHHIHELHHVVHLPAGLPVGSYRVRSRLFIDPPLAPHDVIEVE